MFEVVRYRRRGEFTYLYKVIAYGTRIPLEENREVIPAINRFGPFSTEQEAEEFIEEIEKDF